MARATLDWITRQAGHSRLDFANPNQWDEQANFGSLYHKDLEIDIANAVRAGLVFDATLTGAGWSLGAGGFGLDPEDFTFTTGRSIGEASLAGFMPLAISLWLPILVSELTGRNVDLEIGLVAEPDPEPYHGFNGLFSSPNAFSRGEIIIARPQLWVPGTDTHPDDEYLYFEIPLPSPALALIRSMVTGSSLWTGKLALSIQEAVTAASGIILYNAGDSPIFLRVTRSVPSSRRAQVMVSSDVEIVNLALLALGTTPIAAFSDSSKGGLAARTSYDTILEAVLRAHPWNFATKRISIPSATPSPEWGYDQAYDLPEDPERCLRVLEVNGEDVDMGTWRVEGRQLVTNLESPLDIRYIWKNTQVTQYDPIFVTALAARLAAAWSETFGRDTSWAKLKWEEYKAAIQEAWAIDGQEQVGAELMATTWENAR